MRPSPQLLKRSIPTNVHAAWQKALDRRLSDPEGQLQRRECCLTLFASTSWTRPEFHILMMPTCRSYGLFQRSYLDLLRISTKKTFSNVFLEIVSLWRIISALSETKSATRMDRDANLSSRRRATRNSPLILQAPWPHFSFLLGRNDRRSPKRRKNNQSRFVRASSVASSSRQTFSKSVRSACASFHDGAAMLS